MTSPEHQVETEPYTIAIDQAMRIEVATCGSVPGYVFALGVVYRNDPDYKGNLSQLERLSGIVAPHDYDKARQNGFYWGALLGMSAGDHMFGDDWPELLYECVNKQILVMRINAKALVRQDNGQEYAGPNHNIPLVTTDLFLGTFEDESYALPEKYQDLINEWATELSTDVRQQQYIEAGFNFIVNIGMAQTHYREQLLIAQEAIDSLPESLQTQFDALDD